LPRPQREDQLELNPLNKYLQELITVGPELGIPLLRGELSDEAARRINHCDPLYDGDDVITVENLRTAWLVLYEGARLAARHGVALVLAG
jgi:hypothetical protein